MKRLNHSDLQSFFPGLATEIVHIMRKDLEEKSRMNPLEAIGKMFRKEEPGYLLQCSLDVIDDWAPTLKKSLREHVEIWKEHFETFEKDLIREVRSKKHQHHGLHGLIVECKDLCEKVLKDGFRPLN